MPGRASSSLAPGTPPPTWSSICCGFRRPRPSCASSGRCARVGSTSSSAAASTTNCRRAARSAWRPSGRSTRAGSNCSRRSRPSASIGPATGCGSPHNWMASPSRSKSTRSSSPPASGPRSTCCRELRVALDPILEAPPALAPLIDPNVHSCGTVPPHGAAELAHPEPGFYLVGSKSYGRAPTFLMATGYEQVRSVVAEIAGDHAAAREVRLVLPETGVCGSTTLLPAETGVLAPLRGVAAARRRRRRRCCVKDADAKAAGLMAAAAARPSHVLRTGRSPGATAGAAGGCVTRATMRRPRHPARACRARRGAAAGCCGGPAPAGADACCVKDADAKAAGLDGCGCGTTEATSSVPVAAAGGCCG